MKLSKLGVYLCLALAAGAGFAQSTNAILTGSVADASAAAVVQAVVVARNTQTGLTTTTVSNDSGIYLFPSLQPGLYEVTVQHSGFRQFLARGIKLEVGARVKLDIKLELGSVAETVEVTAQADSPLQAVSAAVGNIVTQQRVLDLPRSDRNASTLINLQAGVVGENFNGLRLASQNFALEGINIQDARFQGGPSNLVVFTSVDLISEFRVITSPADAEFGRGAAQVQMLTRSGNNEFHGSLFEFNRVTALSANTWFNNQRGRTAEGTEASPRNFLVRNQFGGRVGGPIVKNKTFFHFLYDAQRQVTRNAVTSTTWTEPARRGIFRFYPGVQNANAGAAVPVVDFAGHPIRPPAATADLQAVSLFGRDPSRAGLDPSGNVQKDIARLPLPNDFRFGDGLNTAGFTFQRRITSDRGTYNARIDHALTDSHRMAFTYLRETTENINGFASQSFLTTPGGNIDTRGPFYSYTLTSAFRPNLVNEFRAGAQRVRLAFQAPWEVSGFDVLQKVGPQFYYVNYGGITDPFNINMAPQGRISPIYELVNNLTWLKGRHTLKGGIDFRWASTNGFNSFAVNPAELTIGSGAAPPQNINTIPGIGLNSGQAIGVLNDLAGSLSSTRQRFYSPGGPNPQFVAGEYNQKTWRQGEYSFYFKDDWKVSDRLTLNLGIRYEYYGVPYEANGKSGLPVGGSGALFGRSGTTFADLFQPGRFSGADLRYELVGRTTAQPGAKLYREDYNNFAPAVGLSWGLPWFGRDKTVLRLGYGMSYDRNLLRNVDIYAGDLPGLLAEEFYRSSSYLNIAAVPVVTPSSAPLALVPVTDRAQTFRAYDTGVRTPYNQNWNASLQREITPTSSLTIRYVGSKGTKLLRGINLNETNIFENGILNAFLVTQAGGNAPLLDAIFLGINGNTLPGSDFARSNATIQAMLANNNVGGFANFLNSNTLGGAAGQLLRRANLPENFVVANPQVASSFLLGNNANSSFHSLQTEFEKRFSSGWTLQGNYTWGRALGEEEGAGQFLEDSYRTLRNRRLDKRLLAFHRTHAWKANGVWELPFGNGKTLGRNWGSLLDRVLGGWRVGSFVTWSSGVPFDLLSQISSHNLVVADMTPAVAGNFRNDAGQLVKDGRGIHYFADLRQVADPYVGRITRERNIASQSVLKAITDGSGNLLLVNPQPGELGGLGSRYLEGSSFFNVDFSLIKSIRVSEHKNVEIRADFINATNTPSFAAPNGDINSVNFGRITAASGGYTPRLIVLGARFNF